MNYKHTLDTLGSPISVQDHADIIAACCERVSNGDAHEVGKPLDSDPCADSVGEELDAELEFFFGDGGYACYRNEFGLHIVTAQDEGLYCVTITD